MHRDMDDSCLQTEMKSIKLKKDKETKQQQQINQEQNQHLHCILHTDVILLFAFLSSFFFFFHLLVWMMLFILIILCYLSMSTCWQIIASIWDGCGWMCVDNCTTFVSFLIHFVNQQNAPKGKTKYTMPIMFSVFSISVSL